MPGNISEDSGSWIFPRSVPNSFSRRNISEDFGSGFFLIFLGEIFLRILVVDFSWVSTRLVFKEKYF